MTALPASRGPRFVFVTDSRTYGVGPGPHRFAWRLDAANNRPLGRGVGTHPSLEDCRQRLDTMRTEADALVAAVSFDATRGLWTWRVEHDGETCATGVRTYLRRFECRRAVAHFRSTLGGTAPDAGVVRVVRADVLGRYAGDGAVAAS